jgi:hypothetical protein
MPRTYTVPADAEWDALAADLLGSEDRQADLLRLNPLLAVRPTVPGGSVLTLPDETARAATSGPVVTLPPWKR